MPVTIGPSGIGPISLRWHLDDGDGWRLDGIDLPPHSEAFATSEHHPAASRLLEALADPDRRSGISWALAATERRGISRFAWDVLEALAVTVTPGTVIGYGALAERAGHPGAARAVGGVMGANRWPLLIPCHRVVAAGGRIGGFQRRLPDGIARKCRLLQEEGVAVTAGRVRSAA